MELLNDLLNESLGTINQNYTNSKDNIKKCFKSFIELSEKDDIAFNVSMYLFAFCSPVEKTDDSFWFLKYKIEKNYVEYDFAIDLLKNYIKYKTEKDAKLFGSRMKDIIAKFGSYKHISDYISTIGDNDNNTYALISYLIKNPSYFEDMFELTVNPSNIQTPEFISNLKKMLKYKNENVKLKAKVDAVEKLVKKLNSSVTLLKEKLSLYKDDINYLQERIEKIDLRDTLKMSFRYLYNILYSKFPQVQYFTNFWEQINEIKRIFSLPEFIKYNYIVSFIDNIQFYQLDSLNKAAHDPTSKKNLYDIKKYLQNYSEDDLIKIVNFFFFFFYIEDFINLHVNFYFNPKKADEEFQKKIKYSEAFEQIFK